MVPVWIRPYQSCYLVPAWSVSQRSDSSWAGCWGVSYTEVPCCNVLVDCWPASGGCLLAVRTFAKHAQLGKPWSDPARDFVCRESGLLKADWFCLAFMRTWVCSLQMCNISVHCRDSRVGKGIELESANTVFQRRREKQNEPSSLYVHLSELSFSSPFHYHSGITCTA